jgi:hypothetical protein
MTSSNSTKLRINADGTIKLPNDNQKLTIGSSEDLQFYHDSTDNIIKSATSALKIHAAGSNSYTVHVSARPDKETIICYNNTNAPYVELYYDNSKKLETTTTGVAITGLLSATTKSFIIDHPTKENYKLRYACLEGPENSVYIRGRTTDNVIELPDYWTGLVDEDSITVNLTPIGNHSIWIEEINNNKVYINSESKINCFYIVFAERKDVEKLIVEIQEN